MAYTGQEYLEHTQLYHYNSRLGVYPDSFGKPISCRMLSPDKIVANPRDGQNGIYPEAIVNRYAYVLNNPLKYTDPSGWVAYQASSGLDAVGGGVNTFYGPPVLYIDGVRYEGDAAANLLGLYTGGGGGGSVVETYGSTNTFQDPVIRAFHNNRQIEAGNKVLKIRERRVDVQSVSMVANDGYTLSTNNMNELTVRLQRNVDVDSFNNPFASFSQEAQNGGSDNRSFELGPIGIGVTFEIGYPDFLGLESSGFGISFGLVADIKGLSFYITDKTTSNAVAFTLAPEIFYLHGVNKNVYNSDLNGPGTSFGIGLGPMGGEVGRDGGSGKPIYYQYSLSGFGRGIDVEYSNWNTKTKVYNILYPD